MNGKQWTADRTRPKVCTSMPELLGVLAGKIRYEIVTTLARGAVSVGLLAQRLELAVPHISLNLATLRRYGIVEATRVHRRKVYQLTSAVKCDLTQARITLRLRTRDGTEVEIHVEL